MASASRAQPMASVTIVAAPRTEPARPTRNRMRAITGAPVSVLIVLISRDKPLRKTCLPALYDAILPHESIAPI